MDVLSVVDMIGSSDRCHHVTIRARKSHAHQHRIIEVRFLLKQAYVNKTFHMSRVSLEIISCIIICPCLIRTGNYQIREFDWLKQILTSV